MRVAALYDVHGNLPALEAVLREVEAEAPDLVVFGGDVAAGPMPRETVERLMAIRRPTRFVRGNADREVVAAFDGDSAGAVPESVRHLTEWVARQLDRAHRDFLAAFEPIVVVPVAGLGEVLFCHGTPRGDTEIVTPATPDARLRAVLAGVAQRTIVCGHTHVRHDRAIDGIRVVNAGSVGMPYADEPGAYWAMLGPGIELRRTRYDLDDAARRVRASGYPDAGEFAAVNVLRPPTAAEAIAAFEPAAEGTEPAAG